MSKRNKLLYWIATLWLSLGMLATGAVQFLKLRPGAGAADSVTHLGYPLYLLPMLAVWKILGVVVILLPRVPVLKEWAYAGFFFAMSGAVFSHLAVGNPPGEIFPPVLLLFLTLASWYLRPVDRKPGTPPAGSASAVS